MAAEELKIVILDHTNIEAAEWLYRRCGFRETGKRIVHENGFDEIEFALK